MGRKDSDYFLNLQEEIEKSTFFNQMFGYVVYGNSKVYHLVIEKCTTFQSGAKLHLI